VTVIATPNPTFHCDDTVYATEQPVAALAGVALTRLIPTAVTALRPAVLVSSTAVVAIYRRSVRHLILRVKACTSKAVRVIRRRSR
jgi:hypothetical protein